MPDSAALLIRILCLSREMRERALSSDWDSVHEKEKSRQKLIDACFPLDGSITNPAQTDASINEIIELDRSVVSLALVAQNEVGENLSGLKLGRQAKNAYNSVETGS